MSEVFDNACNEFILDMEKQFGYSHFYDKRARCHFIEKLVNGGQVRIAIYRKTNPNVLAFEIQSAGHFSMLDEWTSNVGHKRETQIEFELKTSEDVRNSFLEIGKYVRENIKKIEDIELVTVDLEKLVASDRFREVYGSFFSIKTVSTSEEEIIFLGPRIFAYTLTLLGIDSDEVVMYVRNRDRMIQTYLGSKKQLVSIFDRLGREETAIIRKLYHSQAEFENLFWGSIGLAYSALVKRAP